MTILCPTDTTEITRTKTAPKALAWLTLEFSQMSRPATKGLNGVEGRSDVLSDFFVFANMFISKERDLRWPEISIHHIIVTYNSYISFKQRTHDFGYFMAPGNNTSWSCLVPWDPAPAMWPMILLGVHRRQGLPWVNPAIHHCYSFSLRVNIT